VPVRGLQVNNYINSQVKKIELFAGYSKTSIIFTVRLKNSIIFRTIKNSKTTHSA
jgi:hypothetical protein